jgi:hypothetical protein
MAAPPTDTDTEQSEQSTKIVLACKDIDYLSGIGTAIVDMDIFLEWSKEIDKVSGSVEQGR